LGRSALLSSLFALESVVNLAVDVIVATSRWKDKFVLAAGVIGCASFFLGATWVLRMDEARLLLRIAKGRHS